MIITMQVTKSEIIKSINDTFKDIDDNESIAILCSTEENQSITFRKELEF